MKSWTMKSLPKIKNKTHIFTFMTPIQHITRSLQFSSVAQSCLTLQPHEVQHARLPCTSPTPGVYPNSSPSSRWCHPAISSSVVPFSSCPWSLPAPGSRNSWNRKWRNSWDNLTFWKTNKIQRYLVINQKYTGGTNNDISNERDS